MSAQSWMRSSLLISLMLLILIAVAYFPVGGCGFVNLDDDAYVQYQPMVNQGLRSAALVWAFTSSHASNWHPLTSLSHMIDCQFFGLRPSPMHWENVLWHALNSILVFLVWRTMTSAPWRSGLVAALFALHPLHVESVAWISERKDLLSACFGLVSLWAWLRYTLPLREHGIQKTQTHPLPPLDKPRPRIAYALSLLCFSLALMSKPMLVTLPFLMLLFCLPGPDPSKPNTMKRKAKALAPFFIMACVHATVTFYVQRSAGAANYGQRFSFNARFENAVVSIARYLGKTIWPTSLSPFYAHPGNWPLWTVLGSTGLVIAISVWAVWPFLTSRFQLSVLVNSRFFFGWFWFLNSLVPVLGLVQVGAQSMADRYTYLPLLGIFTIVAWLIPDLRSGTSDKRGPFRNPNMPVGSGDFASRLRLIGIGTSYALVMFALAICVSLTRRQAGAWRSSIDLYQHAIAGGQDNATIRYLLGAAFQGEGRPEADATGEFNRALQLDPTYINALTQLAVIALNHGRADEARSLIERSLQLEPHNPTLHKNLGALCVRVGKIDEAIAHFNRALKLDPSYADAHHEVAWIYLNQSRLEEARIELEAVVRATPWDADALCELGTLAGNLGHLAEARRLLERALWIRPDFPRARDNLRALLTV